MLSVDYEVKRGDLALLQATLEWRGWSSLLETYPCAEDEFQHLPVRQQQIVIYWLRLADRITAAKVVSRAMRYYLNGQVVRISDQLYRVEGDHSQAHGAYLVDLHLFRCPCQRCRGTESYRGKPGPCSHLCAAELLKADYNPD